MSDIYKPVDWTVQQLVDSIRTGVLRLPDLQRPFVWPATKVRDLMDSMYRGYPVGELMFWNRPGADETSSIGLEEKTHASSHQIVDGQQRLTSLYVTMTGRTVIDDDYRDKSVRISFNPFLERFEVAQPAFDRSADWVADVAQIFAAPFEAVEQFTERLEKVRQAPLTPEEKKQVVRALSRVDSLRTRTFKVVELQPSVDKATVADVFVRINSEGVSLTAADFILTWLSVFWSDGRDQIEEFARNSRLTAQRASEVAGNKVSWTPLNHYIAPTPGQLVRVAVVVGQNRGRLQDAYNALRARDRKTGQTDPQRQQEELEKLQQAVPLLLNRLHWDEFIRVLAKAGFRSRKMITSNSTILYCYALWLLGRERYKVDVTVLRDLMARWFFMAQTTYRYTSSPETRIQQDLDRLSEVKTADEFVGVLEGIIATVFTADYWTITLPDEFVSSSTAASPAYQAYLASLNILDANLFMLSETVRDWTDPANTSVRDVEGHHLFPKAYLRDVLGYKDMKRINQVANFAPTDWATNSIISDRPPTEYWPDLCQKRNLKEVALAQQMGWHALPEGWHAMEYEKFLNSRRALMAQVVRDGYFKLSDPNYKPAATDSSAGIVFEPLPAIGIRDLLNADVLKAGALIESIDTDDAIEATITEDGEIEFQGKTYETPGHAAEAAGQDTGDGWDYWTVVENGTVVSLADLRSRLGL